MTVLRSVLMVAVAFTAEACRSVPPPAQPARDVVLITIDTLRVDFVGVYGSQAARTPTAGRSGGTVALLLCTMAPESRAGFADREGNGHVRE